ncbi:MAG: insulinase family protein [Clostridia bacterium]|nr:insulinase family protein [Clostridia bacterium]
MLLQRKNINDATSFALVETDKFKANYMSLLFNVPLSRDTVAFNALLPMVLTRGTANLPSMRDINLTLDNLYASSISPRCFKRGENHFFGFNAYMLDNAYAPDGCDITSGVLEILNDIINNPLVIENAFKKEYVESEKNNLCDRILSVINNKNRYAVTRCVEEMCKDEPFGIGDCGNIDDVKRITASDLYDYYLSAVKNFSSDVFCVGRFDDSFEKGLKDITSAFNARSSALNNTTVKLKADSVKRVEEDQPVKQAKLSIGYRTGITLNSLDYCKFIVFNEIFSSSPMSKLFRNVREKLSLAYYCHSIPEPLKGIMVVSSGIDSSNRQKAEDEIARQLELVRTGDISDDELNSAKASIINAYRELEDSHEALERWYSVRMLAQRSDSPAEAAKDILAVTKEDVIAAANAVSLDTVYYMNPTVKEDAAENE